MKKIAIIFCLISNSIRATSDTLPSYSEGTILNVYASRGMKLRAFPNKNAEVLDIVRYGDEVEVINTFSFSDDKADRIDWLDGHWILVEFDGIAGYLFDAYLSALPFPGSENEICQDGYSYVYTLGEYFDRNFMQQQVLDSSTNRIVYLLDKGIRVKRLYEENVWTIDFKNIHYPMGSEDRFVIIFKKKALFQFQRFCISIVTPYFLKSIHHFL
ncbi:MAG: SH3 domain-containing protein [Saprospiraceae bacterium]|nr:SH3 domain-containing protein [Saprospiraceae bacterium]